MGSDESTFDATDSPSGDAAPRRLAGGLLLAAAGIAFSTGAVLHALHSAVEHLETVHGWEHWFRDSLLSLPLALTAAAVSIGVLSRPRFTVAPGAGAWATVAAAVFAILSIPAAAFHTSLFVDQGSAGHGSSAAHLTQEAATVFVASVAWAYLWAAIFGVPGWSRHPASGDWARSALHGRRMLLRRMRAAGVAAAALLMFASGIPAPPDSALSTTWAAAAEEGTCNRTIFADVVALDQPFYYNRMGALNANGMIFALRRDVVDLDDAPGDGTLTPGRVALAAHRRPRPLTLRANVGDCLEIRFENLLDPDTFVFRLPEWFPLGPMNPQVDNQPVTRSASVHIDGLDLVGDIVSSGTNVGENPSGLVEPGQSIKYRYYASDEGTYLMSSQGATFGSEGNAGTDGYGLFGAVNVEPRGSEWYRSQVTAADMAAATVGLGPEGHPILDYDSVFPAGDPLGRDRTPVLSMLGPKAGYAGEIVYGDLNAIITGPGQGPLSGDYQDRNGTGDRNRPFREFTVIFHDENFSVQAFPEYFSDPTLEHTLHGVRDGFAINYGTGGIGSEIIANRLGVGPMWNCVECKYEEFFLTSWAVGDPAMIVDVPANADLDRDGAVDPGPKATVALYPDDPSNVFHGYLGDRTVFRNLHVGKEHHIFHLHAHQWLASPEESGSAYLDSQAIGPGSAYTYEIAYGAGNRNLTAGDAIFHCHFYPHFAQGMWGLWRVHDTFEAGTQLDGSGRPLPGSRALPDGEIVAGTPVPGVVPIPGRALAPLPEAATTIVAYDQDGNGKFDSSQVDANGDGIADIDQVDDPAAGIVTMAIVGAESRTVERQLTNPGFPFFVPGMAGHRPPSPALDLVDVDGDGEIDDGGLPRHVVVSGPGETFGGFGGIIVEQYQTRLDFNKVVHAARALEIPEEGTAAERAAMEFHADAIIPSATPSGYAAVFQTNGLNPVAGAPFADPCRADDGTPIEQSRLYKGANIQMDVTLNKVGWHFPQQRFQALWEDVDPYLSGTKTPEPLVMRLNSQDCASYWHTNLIPSVYELDDYQVRTPTDIIGQHIHLVKFDVLSADGSANGWNYEDGTMSPDEIRERIEAFNVGGLVTRDGDVVTDLEPEAHPFFGPTGPDGSNWLGARTTIQRWYADPLLERSWDGGLGTVFTHDHYGPSTHQQVGLYSTVLIEPEGAQWRDPESGEMMGGRADGGPTSWRADILLSGDREQYSHREFFLEFADFQHAYQAGGGRQSTIVDPDSGQEITTYQDFVNAINPPFRQEPPSGYATDLVFFPNVCPGGRPRPCPEAISADDPGTYVVNYRNEPIALRMYDPKTKGQVGDLAEAFASAARRMDEVDDPYGDLTGGVGNKDPYTPLLRAYMGDNVRIRLQVGAHEEEHNIAVRGLEWLHESFVPNSGFTASQFMGISAYFNLGIPILPDLGPGRPDHVDYLYTVGTQTEDIWNGVWGLLRTYQRRISRGNDALLPLPNNPIPKSGWRIENERDFEGACPKDAPVRTFTVSAVAATDVLGPDGIVYNSRATAVVDPDGGLSFGPLTDPNGLLYVHDDRLVFSDGGAPIGLASGNEVEPLVMRARAGECLEVQLTNRLPEQLSNLPGFNTLPPIVQQDILYSGDTLRGFTTFNSNDLQPSTTVGLEPQLLAFDQARGAGMTVGDNKGLVAGPGQSVTYHWYAGRLDVVPSRGDRVRLAATPVEFGAANLLAADSILGASRGLVGAVIVEPADAEWALDQGTTVSATVTTATSTFREFVVVLQNDVNMRYSGGCSGASAVLECAVPNIAAEGRGFPEDPQDTGQKAINYGTEPLWYRLGISPDTPFGIIGRTLEWADAIRDIYSSALDRGDGPVGDPETGVFEVDPAQFDETRIRLVQAGGHARGQVITLAGHSWQRHPYRDGSTRIGDNPRSRVVSGQEGVSAGSHLDLVVDPGGSFDIAGDYLLQDEAAFGNFHGLWAIVRVGVMEASDVEDPGPATNTAPEVTVTARPGAAPSDPITLEATVIDDGLPTSGEISWEWSQTSGPPAVIAEATIMTTTASPSESGTYVFMGTASDGELSTSETVEVVLGGAAPASGDFSIEAGEDDVEELSNGDLYVDSSDLELTEDRGPQTVGLRFTGVDIPPGAVIERAWVQFTVDETSSDPVELRIAGEATAAAAPFSDDLPPSRRTLTAAAAQWNPEAWTVEEEAGPAQRTVDLAAVVGEVIGLPGWEAGNAVAIIITGNGTRTAVSFEGDAAQAPVLHVEWTTATVQVPADDPADTTPRTEGAGDSSATTGAKSSIDLEVLVDGIESPSEPGPKLGTRNPVEWTYTVTNTGSEPLYAIYVFDEQLQRQVDCPVRILEPGETTVCIESFNLEKGGQVAEAWVTAWDEADQSVYDADFTYYRGKR